MPNSLVQLSDPHIKNRGGLAYGVVDTARLFRAAVDEVLRLPQSPVAVVVTGDLTDFGRIEEYQHLRELLEPLVCPVYLMPGNHDDRENLRSVFADHAYLHQSDTEFIQYAVDLGGLRLVALDTVVPAASHGALCAARIAELERLLADEEDARTIVAMHHPPFHTFIAHMDAIGLQDGVEALEATIRRFPQVERIICGHLHRPIVAQFAHTVAMTAPSTAHQVCLDLGEDGASAFVMETPGFLVHAWAPDRALVTHCAAIGDFPGPFPFHADGVLID